MKQKDVYREIRTSIQNFRTNIQYQLQSPARTVEQRAWLEKYRTLLAFDFEAAIFLKQWDCLPVIVEESTPIVDDRLSAIYLDAILSSQAEAKDILIVAKVIPTTRIHKSHRLPNNYYPISQ